MVFNLTFNKTTTINLTFIYNKVCVKTVKKLAYYEKIRRLPNNQMEILKKRLPEHIFKQLHEAGLASLEQIITINETALQDLIELSLDEARNVLQEAATIVIEPKVLRASEIPHWERISTGCEVIDSITRGGLPVNGITEIYGESGVGKTQFCLQLCLMVQLPKNVGGLEKGCVFISSEGSFPSKRLHQLAKTFMLQHCDKLNIERVKFEDNIFLDHIADFEQLRQCLCVRLCSFLKYNNIGLIVIDSIAGVFRSENLDTNYGARTQEFQTIARKLNEISEKYNVAILCTNQVTDNPLTNKTEPCLGLSWTNLVTCRFSITKANKIRQFNIIFAPDLKHKSCVFVIEDVGLVSRNTL